MLDKFRICGIIYLVPCAGIAHPVERHLAKVEVASSSLVARSIIHRSLSRWIFYVYNFQSEKTRLIEPRFLLLRCIYFLNSLKPWSIFAICARVVVSLGPKPPVG